MFIDYAGGFFVAKTGELMISAEYFWINIFFLAIGTIIIRGSIIAVSDKIQISDRTKELFSYIPAAILPAFVAPAVFFHQGQVSWAFGKERFIVLILSLVICFKTRSTVATIVVGLLALYVITQVFGA